MEPSSDVRVTLINGLFMQIKSPHNVWECPLILGTKCIKVSSYHNFQPLVFRPIGFQQKCHTLKSKSTLHNHFCNNPSLVHHLQFIFNSVISDMD